MVISTISLKGGAGKTTTSINLAVYFATIKNKNVVIIDTDINKNIEKWNGIRESQDEKLSQIDFIVLNTEEAFKQEFNDIANQYDIVIIDGRPAQQKMVALNMFVADLCVIPVKPSPLDIWCNDYEFIDIFLNVKDSKPELKACFFLNEIKPFTNIANDCKLELEGYFNETGIKCLEHTIDSRMIYRESIMYGIGVVESNNYKAKGEFIRFGDDISKMLNI